MELGNPKHPNWHYGLPTITKA